VGVLKQRGNDMEAASRLFLQAVDEMGRQGGLLTSASRLALPPPNTMAAAQRRLAINTRQKLVACGGRRKKMRRPAKEVPHL
jgi:hypothetical protein